MISDITRWTISLPSAAETPKGHGEPSWSDLSAHRRYACRWTGSSEAQRLNPRPLPTRSEFALAPAVADLDQAWLLVALGFYGVLAQDWSWSGLGAGT
jgi:hypothetical protein